MAVSDNKEVNAKAELKPIEEWCKDLNTSASIYAGIKAANRWRPGKEVTKEEYEKAIDKFLKSPMKGGK